MLSSLAYVSLPATDLDGWAHLATDVLGMQEADRSSRGLAFRVDERPQRLLVDASGGPAYFGWEVAGTDDLHALAVRLDAVGVPYAPLTAVERAQRFVADGLVLADPVGNRVEVVTGPVEAEQPFVPGRSVSGFRTGALGLGHAVLTVPDAAPVVAFYRDVLGFALSDFTFAPFEAYFFHLNARHHSLAIIQTGTVGIHHVMVEMQMLDDVGQSYDLACELTDGVNVTLGRHTNDHMLSFYANTPSGVLLECGWGGRLIEPVGWEPVELTHGPSLWGHERSWLPEDKRAEARELRKQAAVDGVRARVHVHGDNYDVSPL